MMNAQKLLEDIGKQFAKWDERSQFKMRGVGNLSVSDLESLELYAKEFLMTGSINGLMTPRGGIATILADYGIKSTDIWG